jgi:hypothetical protein
MLIYFKYYYYYFKYFNSFYNSKIFYSYPSFIHFNYFYVYVECLLFVVDAMSFYGESGMVLDGFDELS